MENQKAGGFILPKQSAYPTDGAHNQKGLTKLEAFTMAAMQGLCANSDLTNTTIYESKTIAAAALIIARAAMEELSKQQQG